MKFMVDESAGTAVAEYLRGAGHDVFPVAEGMPQADDQHVLAHAMNERRILITNDKDFGELVFRSGHGHHGVLLLRLRDESPANRVRVVKAVLEQWADRLVGCFTVAREGGIRIRPPDGPL
jgi:predicted nuclease of predicted toxin-antitoxin system